MLVATEASQLIAKHCHVIDFHHGYGNIFFDCNCCPPTPVALCISGCIIHTVPHLITGAREEGQRRI